MKTYTPTKGRCIIRFHDPFAAYREAGLELPNMVDAQRDSIGLVEDIRIDQHKPTSVRKGDTVIVPTYIAGVKIGDNREIIRIDDIQAVIQGDPSNVTTNASCEAARCKYCGPANAKVSTNGVLLQQLGPNAVLSCPRCKKDVNGMIPDSTPKISDDELEAHKQQVLRSHRK